MKIITFVIPCFNSSEYMGKCIESCLVAKDVCEILIVDDGSTKDNTYEIAKEYETKYPNICRAIHKENGGHGSVLNVGIKEARGKYIKIVDSDDWLDSKLDLFVNKVCELVKSGIEPDLFISNFIYDKVSEKHKKVMQYRNALVSDKLLTWDDIKKFKVGNYLLMHSLMYKTEVVRKSGLVLPEKTFYVDNIYAYKPLEYVNTLYYIDIDLYHYYIGRSDQSVNEKVMIGRLEQQYKVTYKMIDDVDVMNIKNINKKEYMLNYLSIVITITSILSIRSHEKMWLDKKNELWMYIKNKNYSLYKKLRYCLLGTFMNLPTVFGRKISEFGYKISNKIYGFN